MTEQELVKKNQILYSWSWFYQNSLSSLGVTRYHKVNKTIIDKDTKQPKVIKVDPNVSDDWNRHYGQAIQYSDRAKDDRVKLSAISKEIKETQSKLENIIKKRK